MPVVLAPSELSFALKEQSRLLGSRPLSFVGTVRYPLSDHRNSWF